VKTTLVTRREEALLSAAKATGAVRKINCVEDWPWSDAEELFALTEQLVAIEFGLAEPVAGHACRYCRRIP